MPEQGPAGQGSHGVVQQGGLLLHFGHLAAYLGHAGVVQKRFQLAFQARFETQGTDLGYALALHQSLLQQLALGLQAQQSDVVAGDLRRQQQPCCLRIRLRRSGLANCHIEGCAVLAEPVELITGGGLYGGQFILRPANRWRVKTTAAEALAAGLCAAGDLHLPVCVDTGYDRAGPRGADLCHAQAGAVLQRLLDQRVQARIAKLLPPRVGCVDRIQLGRSQRRRIFQADRCGRAQLRLGRNARKISAATEQRGGGQDQRGRPQKTTVHRRLQIGGKQKWMSERPGSRRRRFWCSAAPVAAETSGSRIRLR